MNKKKIAIGTLVLGLMIAGAVAWQTGIASAYFGGESKDAAAEKLANKLNVSKDQVSTAMDELQTEHQAERKAEISANLDKAVSDGVITAEQKQKILDRMTEMQQKREKEKEEMKKWQEDNGIDMEKLRDYNIGMGKGGRGPGGPMM
ncbi:MAG: hypothetical protein NTW06_04230 [Candidatus Falkowbacteria bacterium]|nr:hypothetical protein [Candidatus Falkowbacteria bacterium]